MAHTASTTAPSDYGTSGSHSRGQLAVSKSDDMLMGDNGILPIKVGPTTESGTQKVADEDFIKRIVNKAVQDVIEDEPYSHDASSLWTNKIAELLVRTFVNIDRDNKYIVTCMIVQNLRQGMRSATSCFWNAQTDSGYSLTNERNGMYVITTVFLCKS